jgi:hypothetical protein
VKHFKRPGYFLGALEFSFSQTIVKTKRTLHAAARSYLVANHEGFFS